MDNTGHFPLVYTSPHTIQMHIHTQIKLNRSIKLNFRNKQVEYLFYDVVMIEIIHVKCLAENE